MEQLFNAFRHDFLSPKTAVGALAWAIVFFVVAMVLSAMIRRFTHRIEARLSDVTGLRFASSSARVLAYVGCAVLYAEVVPELRAFGAALLAGASVVSIVVGLAAQNTLANAIAGLSLVLYRPIHVGDRVQLGSPKGLVTAKVEFISLGHTVLRDAEDHEIIVPNSIMANSVVIRLESGKSGGGARPG